MTSCDKIKWQFQNDVISSCLAQMGSTPIQPFGFGHLTHISLASFLCDIGKQCRSRSDAFCLQCSIKM